jgi:hypothetical protein
MRREIELQQIGKAKWSKIIIKIEKANKNNDKRNY